MHAGDAVGFLHQAFGDENAQRLELLRVSESGLHLLESLKGADHQAGADQQHHRERHLRHD